MMNQTLPKLVLHRDAEGYRAEHGSYRYTFHRVVGGFGWEVFVQRLTETAGVRHTLGQPVLHRSFTDTRALGVAIARNFAALGDDFRSSEHGHKERWTVAVLRAYEQEG